MPTPSLLLALVLVAIILAITVRKPRRRHRPRPTKGFIFIHGHGVKMSFSIRAGQTGVATAVFTGPPPDLTVYPLAPGNVPVWAVSPADALVLSPAADGMTCEITGGSGAPGDFALTATAEGDPTPGVDTLVATIAGVLAQPEDTQGTISVVLN